MGGGDLEEEVGVVGRNGFALTPRSTGYLDRFKEDFFPDFFQGALDELIRRSRSSSVVLEYLHLFIQRSQ